MQDTRDNFRDLAAKAVRLHESGRLDSAAAAYHEILALHPQHAAALQNLGIIAAVQGEHRSAIAYFDKALAVDDRYLPAHFHRAISLEALGKADDAIAGHQRVSRLDPGHYEAHRRLGFLWLAKGDIGRSLDHFGRTYELRRGEDRSRMAARSLTHATRAKLLHDAEQFRALALDRPHCTRFAELAHAYEALARDFPEAPTELTDTQIQFLGEDYNAAIYSADAPELEGPVLAPRPGTDGKGLGFDTGVPDVVVLDDFLAPEALRNLHRYLLASTIWHDFTHIPGHVASYLEDGLACPLLLQIADAARRSFPDVLGPHPLNQAWAFKGLRAGSAIGAHADDAVISINLWLTPHAANAGPEGGMTVCLEPPPPEWHVDAYAKDEARSTAFMDLHAGNSAKVAYRENRAVMFHSRLLHRTDDPQFRPGYENHRLNITLLFGTGTLPN